MVIEDQIQLLSQRIGEQRFEKLCSKLDDAGAVGDAERLLRSSEFFRNLVERQLDWLEQEAQLQANTIDYIICAHQSRYEASQATEASLISSLRVLRQRAMLHIVWRSFTRKTTGLDETLVAMSDLADFVIRTATKFAEAEVVARFGEPIGEESQARQHLIVVGMGKLGGQELNLSSDIDIIFVYDEPGVTRGGRSSTSNQEFFTRVAQLLIKLIDSLTHEGRVFRVDTRLRPFGDSGALVASYPSLENYYQQHGRDWERYALLKSRCITGLSEQTRAFQQLARRFVYRRYTDFSVIDGLRDMKALIDTERVSKDLTNDIKRGPGGIREAEFVVQSHQLTRGGRIPAIQTISFQESVAALATEQCVTQSLEEILTRSYRHLRQVEHGIQALRDEQTHSIPLASDIRENLRQLLGYDSWSELHDEICAHRKAIAAEFEALLSETSDSTRLIIGIDSDSPSLDFSVIRALALRHEGDIVAVVSDFIDETRFRVLDPEGVRRLQKVLPLILKSVDDQDEVEQVLQRLLSIVTSVLKRSAYLVLLSENPLALDRLVNLVSRSEPITEKLIESPELLDELLFPERLLSIPSKDEIKGLLNSTLEHVDLNDLESAMQLLRRFKDAIVFRVACSELEGAISLMKVSDNLSFLAEVIVERAVDIAYAQLVEKYGEPSGDAGFCVMAYGKLGGLELSYESDLDLVFVSSGESGATTGAKPIDNQRFFTRLAQRVIHILSTNMMGGRLYEIDLRLRPNGDSGLVVTSVQALQRYLKHDAWTWEHQALVRARVVAGRSDLVAQVEDIRADVLSTSRDHIMLAADVTSMRQKMRDHSPAIGDISHRVALKYERGGIVDIEFVVQYLVLKNAAHYPDVGRWSDVVRILEALEACEILSSSDANSLEEAYLGLRSSVHRAAVSSASDSDSAEADQLMKQASAVCRRLLSNL
jgi:glutamate-ammonia-ligase adenylyltransferase